MADDLGARLIPCAYKEAQVGRWAAVRRLVMRNPGAWLSSALEVSARLAATPFGGKTRVLGEECAKRDMAPLTLRRSVVAARYCAQHAKSVGLQIEQVVAAVLAVELLIRLERRDRLAANAIRKDVFAGRISVRTMRQKLASIPERRSRRLTDWDNFALSMIDQFYSESFSSFSMGGTTVIGKLLKVDIEVSIIGCATSHAIYMSPLDDCSESAGSSIDDIFPLVMASCLVYPRVNMALHEPYEADRISILLDELPSKLPADLRLIKLYGEDEDVLYAAADGL